MRRSASRRDAATGSPPAAVLLAGLFAVTSQASAGGALLDDFLKPPGRGVCRDTWIVSSRDAMQIENCCEIFRNYSATDRCFRAPACQLAVFHRTANGCLQRRSLTDLKTAMVPGRPTVVFIHGSFISFDFFAEQSPRTARYFECGAGQPLNVIFFTWPSDGALPTCAAAVRDRERRARTNSFYVAELLHYLPEAQAGAPLVLASHSHGGEMVSATLHLLGGGHVAGRHLACRAPVHPRSLMFAPAMDANDYNPGQAFDRALRMTPCMTIIYSRRDIATKVYPLRRLFSTRAMGHTGLTPRNAARVGPLAGRVRNLDVTPNIGCQHVWSAYLEHPEIIRAVSGTLR